MASATVTVVRIYLREGEHLLPRILGILHDEEKVSGVTVTRGIAGFGPDGKMHMASLVDLSLDLPLIVEFYDTPERVEAVLEKLAGGLGLTHVITWPAVVYGGVSAGATGS